jgi:pimeloyl-ACP methyl ester carboxylesterase
MIWQQRGGRGEDTYLLLHGLGATGAVWNGVCAELERCQAGSWIVCDLPGHGGSDRLEAYSVGAMAAALAASLDRERPCRVIAHSLGVYVALALASGWYGVRIASVLGLGPKIVWAEGEVAGAHDLARKPAREFATAAEASTRFRKVSGLDERIAADAAVLARGVATSAGGFRLAADPRTPFVAGAPFDSLYRSARCPVLLGRGEHDAMVSLEDLRAFCPAAFELAGLGHNAHVEAPAQVVDREQRWRALRANRRCGA